MNNTELELQRMFPDEVGRVNGYAFSKGLGAMRRVTESRGYTGRDSESSRVLLSNDQVEDFALLVFFRERDRTQEDQDFSRVIVQSDILIKEGATL